MIRPLYFEWTDDGTMKPVSPQEADRQYVVGERYRMIPWEERSPESHSHFFAALGEAYKNLPAKIADEFQTFDHFRKWCLIRTGFCDEHKFIAATPKEAIALAAFVKDQDNFSVVTIEDRVVKVYTAKSQKRSEMGAKDFQASKQAVLDYAASLIGVSADDLRQNVGKAA